MSDGRTAWGNLPPGVDRVLAMQAAGVNSSPSDLGNEGMAQFEREGREQRARHLTALANAAPVDYGRHGRFQL